MMHVDAAKKDKDRDRDESRVRVSKSDGDGGFKAPALPAKKKKGALGKLGKGMRSTFRKVTGKEKKRKDERPRSDSAPHFSALSALSQLDASLPISAVANPHGTHGSPSTMRR